MFMCPLSTYMLYPFTVVWMAVRLDIGSTHLCRFWLWFPCKSSTISIMSDRIMIMVSDSYCEVSQAPLHSVFKPVEGPGEAEELHHGDVLDHAQDVLLESLNVPFLALLFSLIKACATLASALFCFFLFHTFFFYLHEIFDKSLLFLIFFLPLLFLLQ